MSSDSSSSAPRGYRWGTIPVAAEFASRYLACRFCRYLKPAQDMASHLAVCRVRRRDEHDSDADADAGDAPRRTSPCVCHGLPAHEAEWVHARARSRVRARALAGTRSTPDLRRARGGRREYYYYGDSETLVDDAEGPLQWKGKGQRKETWAAGQEQGRMLAPDLAERFPIVEPPSPVLQPLLKGCGEIYPPPFLDLNAWGPGPAGQAPWSY